LNVFSSLARRWHLLREKREILSFIAKILKERKNIFLMGGRGGEVGESVTSEMFTGRLISSPKQIRLRRESDHVADTTDKPFMFKGDDSFGEKGFFIFTLALQQEAEVVVEKAKMDIALDPPFLSEIIDQKNMMGRIPNLPEQVKPVFIHIHEVFEGIFSVARSGTPANRQAKLVPVKQKEVCQFVPNAFNSLFPVQRIHKLDRRGTEVEAHRSSRMLLCVAMTPWVMDYLYFDFWHVR
jgi:hypothetical protein